MCCSLRSGESKKNNREGGKLNKSEIEAEIAELLSEVTSGKEDLAVENVQVLAEKLHFVSSAELAEIGDDPEMLWRVVLLALINVLVSHVERQAGEDLGEDLGDDSGEELAAVSTGEDLGEDLGGFPPELVPALGPPAIAVLDGRYLLGSVNNEQELEIRRALAQAKAPTLSFGVFEDTQAARQRLILWSDRPVELRSSQATVTTTAVQTYEQPTPNIQPPTTGRRLDKSVHPAKSLKIKVERSGVRWVAHLEGHGSFFGGTPAEARWKAEAAGLA